MINEHIENQEGMQPQTFINVRPSNCSQTAESVINYIYYVVSYRIAQACSTILYIPTANFHDMIQSYVGCIYIYVHAFVTIMRKNAYNPL